MKATAGSKEEVGARNCKKRKGRDKAMETAQRKASHGAEMRIETNRDKGDSKEEFVLKFGNREDNFEHSNLKPLSPADDRDGKQVPVETKMEASPEETNPKASSLTQKEQEMDQLESAKAEMTEVRRENQRLRMYLDHIMKDYQALQMQFQEIVQQEAKKAADTANSHQEEEESELVSLSLGRTSSTELKSEEKYKIPAACREEDQEDDAQGLALGLDCKFEVSKAGPTESSMIESPEISLEEVKEEAAQTWPPCKALKTERSVDDEVSQQNPAKKARVSVRVRCETPTMNDGCQWRKYGQKIAKGNPCPRAYYRCTLAPSCPVRKQVQRYAEDMSILITTYEGTHNHPLPMSATAMASTTSAAASILMSGSSTSGSGLNSSCNATTTSAELHGLNFYLSDPSKTKQFYLPNSCFSSSHPTITLDLTTNNSSSSSSHFNRTSAVFPPRYSSTNLNFSSLESNPLPISWNNSVLNSFGTQPYSKNQIGTLNFGKLPQENLYQSYAQKSTPSSEQSLPQDTIAAATKAITSDPSFQSVLAAALTSIIGSNGSSGNGATSYQHAGDKFGQNLLLGDSFPRGSNFPSTSNTNKCSSSILNKSPSTANAQQGSLTLLPASYPFSPSKSNSTSPGDR